MSGNGEEYWRQMATETHAKLVDTREQLARAMSANHMRASRIREELFRARELAREYVGLIQRGGNPGASLSRNVASRLDEAISKAGGGG